MIENSYIKIMDENSQAKSNQGEDLFMETQPNGNTVTITVEDKMRAVENLQSQIDQLNYDIENMGKL
jgi:hypothetical protein